MSSASRSRMAFWYSVRLSRRNVSVRPGSGCSAAARSSEPASTETTESYVRPDGRTAPSGGIWRATSFRTTFSQAFGFRLTSSEPMASRASPAVLSSRLWHATQYRLTNRPIASRSFEPPGEDGGAACCLGGARTHEAAGQEQDRHPEEAARSPSIHEACLRDQCAAGEIEQDCRSIASGDGLAMAWRLGGCSGRLEARVSL